jgi:hypothetical protein
LILVLFAVLWLSPVALRAAQDMSTTVGVPADSLYQWIVARLEAKSYRIDEMELRHYTAQPYRAEQRR